MKPFAVLIAATLVPFGQSALAAPASSSSPTQHIVREGETLNGIANRAGVTSKAIINANGLKTPFIVRTGQRLKLPRPATTSAPATRATAIKSAARTSAPASTAPRTSPRANGAATAQSSTYVVKPGETLGGIANREKVPRILIAEANGLTPPYYVQLGRKLLIPRTRRYVVKPGDTGFDISYRHAVPWEQIAVANGLEPSQPVKPGKELLIPTVLRTQSAAQADRAASRTAATANTVATAAVAASVALPNPTQTASSANAPRLTWPLNGPIRRGWKSRASTDHHDGIDITAPVGRSVKAAAPGTVIYAGSEPEQFGNLVVVDHGGGLNTAYGFLSRITVKNGAKVAAGQQIGLVGTTGRARGSELHFELRQNGVPVDPISQLPRVR